MVCLKKHPKRCPSKMLRKKWFLSFLFWYARCKLKINLSSTFPQDLGVHITVRNQWRDWYSRYLFAFGILIVGSCSSCCLFSGNCSGNDLWDNSFTHSLCLLISISILHSYIKSTYLQLLCLVTIPSSTKPNNLLQLNDRSCRYLLCSSHNLISFLWWMIKIQLFGGFFPTFNNFCSFFSGTFSIFSVLFKDWTLGLHTSQQWSHDHHMKFKESPSYI